MPTERRTHFAHEEQSHAKVLSSVLAETPDVAELNCVRFERIAEERKRLEASACAAVAKRRALISCAYGGRICCKGVLVLVSKGRPRVLQYKPRLPQSTRVAWNYRSDAPSAFSLKPGRTLSPTSFLTAQA